MYLYDELLELLQTSPVLQNLRVVDLKNYGTTAFRIKIQANVSSTWTFQIWLNHNPEHIRYAYQLFETDKPLLRWDNAPHHPQIGTNFPHHFHYRPCPVSTIRLGIGMLNLLFVDFTIKSKRD
jgi:hypothetical protein